MYNTFSNNSVTLLGIPIKGFPKGVPITWRREGRDWGRLTVRLSQSSTYNTAMSSLITGTNYEVIEGVGNTSTMRCTPTRPIPIRFPVVVVVDGRQDVLAFQTCAIEPIEGYGIGEEVGVNSWTVICTGIDVKPLGALEGLI